MARRLPPLNGLKAFEAAARHESFTRAGQELCVTQGAVRHQVKALEAKLGVRLFQRERQAPGLARTLDSCPTEDDDRRLGTIKKGAHQSAHRKATGRKALVGKA